LHFLLIYFTRPPSAPPMLLPTLPFRFHHLPPPPSIPSLQVLSPFPGDSADHPRSPIYHPLPPFPSWLSTSFFVRHQQTDQQPSIPLWFGSLGWGWVFPGGFLGGGRGWFFWFFGFFFFFWVFAGGGFPLGFFFCSVWATVRPSWCHDPKHAQNRPIPFSPFSVPFFWSPPGTNTGRYPTLRSSTLLNLPRAYPLPPLANSYSSPSPHPGSVTFFSLPTKSGAHLLCAVSGRRQWGFAIRYWNRRPKVLLFNLLPY